MKKSNKKEKIILLFLALLLLTAGCRKQDKMAPSKSSESGFTGTQQPVMETEVYPETISQQLTEHVTIDVDVDIPEGFDFAKAKIGLAKKHVFDAKKAKEVFMSGTEIESVDKSDDNGIKDELYIGKDGSALDVEPEMGYLTYSSNLAGYVWQAFRIMEGIDTYNEPCYSTSDNLPFADRKQVYQAISHEMKKLGITLGENYICYALPHKTMEEQEIAYNKSGEETEENKKEHWTKEDDCYYFEFSMEYDGSPVYMEGYGDSEDGKGMLDSTFTALYNKKGFVDVNMDGIYDFSDTGETEQVLSPQEAVQALKEKYDSVILMEDIRVEEMKLRYMPLFDADGNYPVKPVWIFKAVSTDKETGMEYSKDVLLDGNTGKEVF